MFVNVRLRSNRRILDGFVINLLWAAIAVSVVAHLAEDGHCFWFCLSVKGPVILRGLRTSRFLSTSGRFCKALGFVGSGRGMLWCLRRAYIASHVLEERFKLLINAVSFCKLFAFL